MDTSLLQTTGFRPATFIDDMDVAECALDEQLEMLYRRYAAASRALARANFETELLRGRDDIHPTLLEVARNRHAAAEIRCGRLMQAIDALEERLERPESGE